VENNGKANIGGIFVVLFIGLCVLFYVIGSSSSSKSAPDLPERTVSNVVYNLSGTASSASITIETPTGTSQQDTSVPIVNKAGTTGLRFDFSPGDFLYLSAQNNGSGELTCHIRVDGVEISANTAIGEYQIATCKGTAF